MEVKVERVVRKVKVGRERRRGWDEVNGDVDGVKKTRIALGSAKDEEGNKGEVAEGIDVENEADWADEDDKNGIVEMAGEEREAQGLDINSSVVSSMHEGDGLENEEDKIT